MDNFESQLISKCKNGDIQSFEILIDSYSKQVFNILYRMLGNEEDAKDVSQEVFIKVYKKIGSFHGKSKFSTWLYRITVNSGKDHIKRKKVDLPIDEFQNTKLESEPRKGSNPEAAFDETERSEIILKALMKLNEEHRVLILLRDIQGFSYEDIGKILKINIGTVKSRLNRGRIRLKDLLKDEFYFGREV